MSDLTPDEFELPEYCEGFLFRYFAADVFGRAIEVKPNAESLAAEEKILKRVAEVLKNRPDIMETLACLDNALEIHLYQGKGFTDEEQELYFFGRATVGGDEVIMELSTDEVLYGGGEGHGEVLDVVVHELMHVIDLVTEDDDEDGLLPGLSPADIERFKAARDEERTRIREGESPLVGYALTDDLEFLAVLAETFFMRPKALRQTNATLYQLMADFFKLDPTQLPGSASPPPADA